MNDFYIFIIRLILGIAFGILLTRIFRPEWSILHGLVMGLLLVAASYLLHTLRNRNKS